MGQRARIWILLFALLGLGASSTSAYVHSRMLRDPSYRSFCDVSQSVNCEAAYMSRYGVVRGVPVAIVGAIWFALVLLLTIGSKSRDTRAGGEPDGSFASSASTYVFVLATLALAVIFRLAYASFVELKVLCVLCLVTYVAVLGVFLVSGSASRVAVASVPRRLVRDLRTLVSSPMPLVTAIVFMAGAASAIAFFPGDTSRGVGIETLSSTSGTIAGDSGALDNQLRLTIDERAQFEQWFAAAPRVPLIIPGGGAQVVIVKFNDYQCPACAETYLNDRVILEKYRAERPGAVALVMKDYPLEPECNPNLKTVVHEAACEGAVAVRLARSRNRGDAMEEWLFTHQRGITPAGVRRAALDIGGVPDFDAQYARMLREITADVQMAAQLGVRGTPTFFINGVRVDGGLRPQFLAAAIELELRKASPKSP